MVSWVVGFVCFALVSCIAYLALGAALEFVWQSYFPELAYTRSPGPPLSDGTRVYTYTYTHENPIPQSWEVIGQELIPLAIGAFAGKVAGDHASR